MPPQTPSGTSTDADSDMEFQSAVSHSPIDGRNSLDDANAIMGQAYSPGLDMEELPFEREHLKIPGDIETKQPQLGRPRMPSNATARRVNITK